MDLLFGSLIHCGRSRATGCLRCEKQYICKAMEAVIEAFVIGTREAEAPWAMDSVQLSVNVAERVHSGFGMIYQCLTV